MDTGTSWRGMVPVGIVCLVPAALWFTAPVPLVPSLAVFLNLWVLALYDWRSYRLPNLFTLTFALAGALYMYAGPRHALPDHVIGGLVGLLFFPALNTAYRLVRGRDGIGLGDAKLLGGIGLWLGWQALPFVLLIASVAGLGYGLLTIGLKKAPIATARIPFGPFLCLGCWLVWLYF